MSLQLSTVTATIYILTNSVLIFPFLHTLSSMYYLQVFDDGHSDCCNGYLIVTVICISLVISIEYPYMCRSMGILLS